MKKVAFALLFGASMLAASAPASSSIIVDFSLTGSALEPGDVTGHLVFDAAGNGVQATGVYLDSGSPFVAGFARHNFLDAARVTQNSFNVGADGAITSAALSLSSTFAYANVGTTWIQLNGFGGYNDVEQDYTAYYNGGFFRSVQNQAGFAGATYAARATGAVPEPSAWAMLIVGFGLVGTGMRRRKPAATVAFA